MDIAIKHRVTVEEFDRWVELPENADKVFEFIGGEIVEVPSNLKASTISSRVSGFIFVYLQKNDIAHLGGEAGGFYVAGERYAPDVSVLLKAKQAEPDSSGYNSFPPDLAVEVDFPTSYQTQEQLRIKVVNYLAAGTVVWLVRPENKTVEVYRPGLPVKILGLAESLDGDDILPGFMLAVKDVFGE